MLGGKKSANTKRPALHCPRACSQDRSSVMESSYKPFYVLPKRIVNALLVLTRLAVPLQPPKCCYCFRTPLPGLKKNEIGKTVFKEHYNQI